MPKRSAPPLLWPPLLELPPPTTTLVYLDLNHWISLAQASVGHPQGRPFSTVLESCHAARTAGARFVLSATHYLEMLKIRDPSQRRDLADVMEQLTDFSTLVSRIVVMTAELSAVLDQVAKPAVPLVSIPLIGRGALHAFGRVGGLRIRPLGDQVRQHIGEARFNRILADAELRFERSVLRGPTDDEVEKLRSLGWDPATSIEIAERRALQEREQGIRLSAEGGRWRRGRLRDVLAAGELIFEFKNVLLPALLQRGLMLDRVVSDRASARAFVRAMPSTEVTMELKTAWHRNPHKEWLPNDIYDIDGLSLAVPYCDVVVTEKACHHALKAAGLGERMHTGLLRKLQDLPALLTKWKPKRPEREGF